MVVYRHGSAGPKLSGSHEFPPCSFHQLMTAFVQKGHICSLYVSDDFDKRHADLFELALHQSFTHVDTNTVNRRHMSLN